MWMKVKKMHKDAIVPTRAHDTDAGLDVYACEWTAIQPGSDTIIHTGISMAIPDGWVAIVKEKSGIATKNKWTIGACVIDSSYRGELLIHIFNNTPTGVVSTTTCSTKIFPGDAIAQLLIVPCWCGQPEVVDDLDETERGSGGFGSTGAIHSDYGFGSPEIQECFCNKMQGGKLCSVCLSKGSPVELSLPKDRNDRETVQHLVDLNKKTIDEISLSLPEDKSYFYEKAIKEAHEEMIRIHSEDWDAETSNWKPGCNPYGPNRGPHGE